MLESILEHTQLTTKCLDKSPMPAEIDAAYAVKVFLDHHPSRHRSIAVLARQSGISEERLQVAFAWIFREPLDQYWKKMQWRTLSGH